MANKKKLSLIFWFLLIVLGSDVLILNLKFQSAVEGLYARGKVELLKKLTFSNEKEVRPVEYYTGKIENAWVGPLTSVVSGGLLLFFCLLYLQGTRAFRFGLAVFLYLLITKFRVLFDPPYGDALFAVLSEPLWLVRHHLHWLGEVGQSTYIQGGPLVYPDSIYPKFIALLLYFSPSPQVFLLLNHLIVFVAGSVVAATLREILREFTDDRRAMLGAILFLALPLFQGQVELLNMEMVCTCFAVLCLRMALRKDFFWASVLAVLTMMIKAPGAITVVAVFGACLLSGLSGSDKKKFTGDLAWVLGACGVAFCLSLLRHGAFAHDSTAFKLALGAGWYLLKHQFLLWFFVFLSGVYGIQGLLEWRSAENTGRTLPAFLTQHYKSLVVFLLTASWFLLYFNAPMIIPRYSLLTIPALLVLFVYLLTTLVPGEKVYGRVMAALILLALAGSHGLLYGGESPGINFPEQSLEYRNVLQVYRRAAREIETNYAHCAIGSQILIAQSLTFPEAGYVRKPLKDVFVYGSGATHEGIHPYPGLANIKTTRTVWVAQTDGDPTYASRYPIGDGDTIFKEIWSGNKRITFFMGGYSIEQAAQYIEQFAKPKQAPLKRG